MPKGYIFLERFLKNSQAAARHLFHDFLDATDAPDKWFNADLRTSLATAFAFEPFTDPTQKSIVWAGGADAEKTDQATNPQINHFLFHDFLDATDAPDKWFNADIRLALSAIFIAKVPASGWYHGKTPTQFYNAADFFHHF